MADGPAVEARDVWFAYGREWVLHDVTLTIPQGAFMALLGRSGVGKTTLLKLLAGLLRPSRGTVAALGHWLHTGLPPELRGRIGYIPQQLGLVRTMTALENVLLGSLSRRRGLFTLMGIFPREEVERARQLLAALGLGDKAGEKVQRLSGGQRQRVAIARTLLQRPRLVLADEFVSELDLPLAADLLTTIRKTAEEEGITYLMALHEVPLVQEFTNEVVILKEGTIVHQGLSQDMGLAALKELTL
jgi:phosphonate transport system ATP-binding protein